MTLLLLTLCLLCAFALTWVVRRYALQHLMDEPNERSSHSTPTPRGGGVSIVMVAVAVSAIAYLTAWIDLRLALSICIFGGLVAVVGYIDDHRDLSAGIRFAVHLFSSAAVMALFKGLPEVPLFGFMLDLSWLGYAVGAVVIAWFLNLFNFMDGIDGIAATEAVCIFGGLAFFEWFFGSGMLNLYFLCLVAAVLGFLVWNWPPARIFMGDAGSGFLGFALAACALYSARHGATAIWVFPILGGVFIVDATYTLLVRMATGQKWSSPHCSHAYQHAAKQLGAHLPVTLSVALVNAFWLFPLACLAQSREEYGLLILLVAYFPLVVVQWKLRAGKENGHVVV